MLQITGVTQPGIFSNVPTNEFLGQLVSRLLIYAILGSGILFFIRLVLAGYSYLTSLGDPTKLQSATKEITNAVIGFLVVISSYFIIQIIEVVFGLKILN